MFLRISKLILIFLTAKSWAHKDVNKLMVEIITSSINNTADSCHDFYNYACGNYAEQHRGSSYKEITGLLDQHFNIKILNLMDSLYQHDYQVSGQCQSFVEKARVYLKACRAENKRNVTKYFEEIIPGPHLNWPVFQQQNAIDEKFNGDLFKRNFNIWSLLGTLQSYGLNNVLIQQNLEVDNEGKLIISLEPPTSEDNTTLPEPALMQVFLSNLGVKQPTSVINKLKLLDDDLLNILKTFAEESVSSIELSYRDLKIALPNLKFSSFYLELLGQELRPDSLISLKNPAYFQYLNDYLEANFDKENLCNYVLMKLLYYLALDSTSQFKSLDCVKDLRNKFDLAVNFLYYQHIYACQAETINKDIDNLFSHILHQLNYTFQENKLNLTDFQIVLLKEKLSQIRLNIGNLPADVSFSKVEEFYNQVPPLVKNNYYKNHLVMLKHRFLKTLHSAQKQSYFIVTDNNLGSSSGPFYVAQQNMIILPFGSLAQPLYDYHLHDLYKYSLLGFVLAHELTHAFDTYGLNFNGQGLEDLYYFSTILSNENFQLSLDCLESQLPTEAIEERIADIVAIQTVYRTFVAGHNPLQPEYLNSVWNKIFFLNTAQFFCGKKNIKFIGHDTDADRLNQIVVNSWGFQQAFKCPVNSKMNPKNKCRLY